MRSYSYYHSFHDSVCPTSVNGIHSLLPVDTHCHRATSRIHRTFCPSRDLLYRKTRLTKGDSDTPPLDVIKRVILLRVHNTQRVRLEGSYAFIAKSNNDNTQCHPPDRDQDPTWTRWTHSHRSYQVVVDPPTNIQLMPPSSGLSQMKKPGRGNGPRSVGHVRTAGISMM